MSDAADDQVFEALALDEVPRQLGSVSSSDVHRHLRTIRDVSSVAEEMLRRLDAPDLTSATMANLVRYAPLVGIEAATMRRYLDDWASDA